MRIISNARVREFIDGRVGDQSEAEKHFNVWIKIVGARGAKWANFEALREVFPTADQVGDCVVFDVGVFRYRLVAFVRYARGNQGGVVYARKIMDLAEYDKNRWVEECGCRKPRPPKPAVTGPAKGMRKGRKT